MFEQIKNKVNERFNWMQQNGGLFVVDLDRDDLVIAYLDCFSDEIERQHHNCSCCKHFLRTYGSIISIIDGKVYTLWDFYIDGKYNKVPSTLENIVRKAKIKHPFFNTFSKLGTDHNIQLKDNDETIRWDHFSVVLDKNKVLSGNKSVDSIVGDYMASKQVITRSLEELTIDATETVLELIAQNSLYRGEEHKAVLEKFLVHQKVYESINDIKAKEIYVWSNLSSCPRIRNSAIGTLLIDLSESILLDVAVTKFEKVVAPSNYKRPTALVTKQMLEKAENDIKELGYYDSINRRHAISDDIPIEQLIFVDRDITKSNSIFEQLKDDVLVSKKQLSKIEVVSIDNFINDIVPNVSSVEVLLEKKHDNNLMSLIAPQSSDAPCFFKWNNGISWSYTNGNADSTKELVKDAGGKVDGVLRYSIRWNDNGDNNVDFDAHCYEPDGNLIYFSNKGTTHKSSGMLDVDIVLPKGKIAVENITWSNESKMQHGVYKFYVHNFDIRTSSDGFIAELEYDGELYNYEYNKNLRGKETVLVAEIDFKKNKGFRVIKSLDNNSSDVSSSPLWNMCTNKFYRISMIMNSPNHWDENDKKQGNKHTFFIINDAINNESPRGIFNEFLKPELYEHKRAFELLGSKLKIEHLDNQLSGLGFSSTQRNEVIVKVTGNFTRILKVKF